MGRTLLNGASGRPTERQHPRVWGLNLMVRLPSRMLLTISLAVALFVGVLVPATSAGAETSALDVWTFHLDVDERWTHDGFNETFRATYTDRATDSSNLDWSASRSGVDRFPCPSGGGTSGADINGSGTGTGTFAASSAIASDWGLTGSWTAIAPFPVGDYALSGTSYRCDGTREDASFGTEGPIIGAIFLPGTWEELAALPIGTTFSYSYNRVYSGSPAPTTTVSYTATKGASADTDGDGVVDSEDFCPTVFGSRALEGCPAFDATARYADVGSLPGFTGGDTADVAGTDLTWLRETCIYTSWTATVKNPKSTVPVLWNGGPAEALEIDSVNRTLPTRSVGPHEIPKFPSGIFIETITMHKCGPPGHLQFLGIVSVGAFSGNVVSLSHTSKMVVRRSDGAEVASITLPGSSSGKGGSISWSEQETRHFG